MVFVVIFVMSAAANDDSDSSDLPNTSDLLIKAAIPSAISGALGAYIGFKYLWSQMPSSEITNAFSPPPKAPPEF